MRKEGQVQGEADLHRPPAEPPSPGHDGLLDEVPPGRRMALELVNQLMSQGRPPPKREGGNAQTGLDAARPARALFPSLVAPTDDSAERPGGPWASLEGPGDRWGQGRSCLGSPLSQDLQRNAGTQGPGARKLSPSGEGCRQAGRQRPGEHRWRLVLCTYEEQGGVGVRVGVPRAAFHHAIINSNN